MAHLTTGQLLELRDGEATPEVAAHIESCATCAKELARLARVRADLRALPTVAPAPEAWQRIEAALAPRHRRPWVYGTGLAVAASMVMAVALLMRVPVEVAEPELVVVPQVAMLAARSRELDALLAQLDTSGRVLDLGTAGTIVALEDRIAGVDARLRRADTTEAAALWQQRVDLMQALVGMHAASGHQASTPRTF